MNSRTLILVVLAIALVGGLGFLLTREKQTPAPNQALTSSETPTRAVQADPEPTPRVSTQLRTTADSPPGPLTVLAMGPKGQSLPEAQITVKGDDGNRTAVGRGTFYDLDAGEWTVEVAHEGFPTFSETVTLEKGQPSSRVIARLDDKALMNGWLVDQYGDLVSREPMWLLPEGAEHPESAQATNGAIRSQSGMDGSFKYRSIDPGEYRLSVCKAGEDPRYVSNPFELVAGRERVARLTITANASILVSAEGPNIDGRTVVQVLERRALANDTGGPGDSAGFGGLDRGAEVKRALREKRAAAGADDVGFSAGGDYGDEGGKNGELTPEQAAQRQAAQERAQRALERRSKLHEPGWVSVTSIQLENGEANKVDDLPPDATLRFVVYRGAEGLLVANEFSVPKGARATLVLNPPPPLTPGTELPVDPRICSSQKSIVPLPRDVADIGIEWLEE